MSQVRILSPRPLILIVFFRGHLLTVPDPKGSRFQKHLGPPGSIDVQTLNHVVYLNGEVYDALAKSTAVSVAKQVAGVTDVVNNIAVNH
jgi:BON domain